MEKSKNRGGHETGQTVINRFRNIHDIIDPVSIR